MPSVLKTEGILSIQTSNSILKTIATIFDITDRTSTVRVTNNQINVTSLSSEVYLLHWKRL